jgi:sulfur carrier protein
MDAPIITVNKQTEIPWRANLTIQDVIQMMNYTFPHIIVSLNGEVVRHDTYEEILVPPNADVRIVHLIAGG